MTAAHKLFADLPGWTFEIQEVSAGVFRVRAVADTGRSIEMTGTDPDEVLKRCREAASVMS
jgi:hypothetical protein